MKLFMFQRGSIMTETNYVSRQLEKIGLKYRVLASVLGSRRRT
jgi:hypothetical protein